jgi:hypothetical protein
MSGVGDKDSRRNVQSQYILSLMFVMDNHKNFSN